jgi:RNA polymerase sigma factor (sigma-70 family)
MSCSALAPLHAWLQGLAASSAASDAELLDRFARQQDQAAFTTLVRRHGPMVLGVCQRLLAQAQDAEDAFQAVFLLLSRRAGGLQRPEGVANWLYGVAYRTALQAQRTRRRHCQREQAVPSTTASADPLAEISAREALAAIEAELAYLPDKYRTPLVLCALEGLTREEAAEQLGWSAALVKSRLETGRQHLRQRLSRKGLVLPMGLGALLCGTGSLSAQVPAALVQSTTIAVLAFVSTGTVHLPSVAALVQGGRDSMFRTRLHALSVLGCLLIGLALCAIPMSPAKSMAMNNTPPLPHTLLVPQENPKGDDEEKRPFLVKGQVTDGQGKPMPGVTVRVQAGVATLKPMNQAITDKAGKYEVRFGPGMLMAGHRYGAGLQAAIITVRHPGYYEKDLCKQGGLMMASTPLSDEEMKRLFAPGQSKVVLLPHQAHTVDFVLVPAASLKGQLTTPQGKPLGKRQLHLHGKEYYPASSTQASVTTDADGRFEIKDIPLRPYFLAYEVKTQEGWRSAQTPPINFTTAGEYQADVELYDGLPYSLWLTLREVQAPKEKK